MSLPGSRNTKIVSSSNIGILWKNIYSTTSFRVRILLTRSHTYALQSIRISCCVAVLACGLLGQWPFRFVAVPICGNFSLRPIWFVAFSVVVVLTCYSQIYAIYVHTFLFIVSLKSSISLTKWFSRFHPAETSFCWHFCIEYTTRILQLWVLISTVHLTNNMHVRIYMQYIPRIMKTNIRQYTVAYSVLNWGVVVSVRRCFGLSTFWSVKFLVGLGRSPRWRLISGPRFHALLHISSLHTYISIGLCEYIGMGRMPRVGLV